MGVSLKDIFKKDEERLYRDRRKVAIRNLIIFTCIIFVLLIGTLVINYYQTRDDNRRIAITKDARNIQTAIKSLAEAHITNNSDEDYPGINLAETPEIIKGEEYRYGYYFIKSEELSKIAVAPNYTDEQYIVNYETGDVVNVKGVKYNKKTYHTVDDMIAIENGEVPPSDRVVMISKAADLEAIRRDPKGYYKLSANIDMSVYSQGEGWKPIESFDGTFDGRGYSIKNLYINRPGDGNVGLFGKVNGSAKISNVTFEDVDISGRDYTGVLAGYCSGAVSNVHVKGGNVKGANSSVGGLIGEYNLSKLSNCIVVLDTVEGKSDVGGIIGSLQGGIVNRVRFEGKVNATGENGGGLIGIAIGSKATEITECAATNVRVNGYNNLGGFIGKIHMNAETTINVMNSYAIGSVESGVENLGGMIGEIYTASSQICTIRLVYLYCNVNVVNKGSSSGGFIGFSNVSNSTAGDAEKCYWKKDIVVGTRLEGTGKVNSSGKRFLSTALETDGTNSDPSKMERSYVAWDFSRVWAIEERVTSPYLRWENMYKTEEYDV